MCDEQRDVSAVDALANHRGLVRIVINTSSQRMPALSRSIPASRVGVAASSVDDTHHSAAWRQPEQCGVYMRAQRSATRR
ncbi:hypothetical protein KWS_0125200 [Xanthomonas vasicola pv. musacearum NCPPB 4384]|nr:hypothetical protein KWS_0125200 [Xanthomonas vasicola pv. musacearum NCPPB 4384]